ncbi:MAG: acyl-CoA dehydrogenase family protein [Stellaceae bacterium]
MATGAVRNEVADSEYVTRAQAVAPKLRDRSEAINALGRVPRETIDEILAAGLFTLLQPKRFGGTERGLVPFLDCVTTLASGCGSVGWVFSVISIHQFHLALFELDAQDEVWGSDPKALLASSYMPGGKACAYRAATASPAIGSSLRAATMPSGSFSAVRPMGATARRGCLISSSCPRRTSRSGTIRGM